MGMIFWHSIWNIFWHSIWYSIRNSFSHSIWHSIWQIFWHSIWHILWLLSVISSDILSGISSDILSGIPSDILSGILSGILFGILYGFVCGRWGLVEVRRGPQCSDSRLVKSGEAHNAQTLAGWSPARPTALKSWQWRSGEAPGRRGKTGILCDFAYFMCQVDSWSMEPMGTVWTVSWVYRVPSATVASPTLLNWCRHCRTVWFYVETLGSRCCLAAPKGSGGGNGSFLDGHHPKMECGPDLLPSDTDLILDIIASFPNRRQTSHRTLNTWTNINCQEMQHPDGLNLPICCVTRLVALCTDGLFQSRKDEEAWAQEGDRLEGPWSSRKPSENCTHHVFFFFLDKSKLISAQLRPLLMFWWFYWSSWWFDGLGPRILEQVALNPGTLCQAVAIFKEVAKAESTSDRLQCPGGVAIPEGHPMLLPDVHKSSPWFCWSPTFAGCILVLVSIVPCHAYLPLFFNDSHGWKCRSQSAIILFLPQNFHRTPWLS